MEKKLKVDINIEGTPITHFSTFNLDQKFNEHHTFQLRFNHDMVEEYNAISLEKSKDFIGKNISVQFGMADSGENIFSGIVTKVELSQSNGFHSDILVSGFSPGILIDRGPDLGSYLNKNLSSIIQLATQDAPQNDLSLNIKPTNTAPIDYIIQYRESDYEFINRLSAEYHEWFYYDGVKLNFGKPDKLDEVDLIYGRDLHSLQYAMQIAPLKQKKFAYNSLQDEILSAEPPGASGGTPDTSHAISASNKVFSKVYNGPMNVRVNNKKEIDDFVSNEQKALISDLVNIVGNGDNPMVGLGKTLNISMSMRGASGFDLQDFGKFMVTAVYHQIDGVGHYQNTFEGVTADTERVSVQEAEKPNPDMQLAIVLDNDDPQKQGRIKVQFKWQCTSNDPTEWLRVISPNAGSGDTGKNRGFLVVPEKGDQVIIGFEEGNIARPVVMGSVYHSNNVDSGGFTNSNIKGMTSRRGSNLTFDDGAHALTLATSAANAVNVHEQQGAVQTDAAKFISHKTGDNTMIMNNDDGLIGLSALKKIIHESGGNGVEIQSDNGSILITAKQSIVIQCGESKITITPEQIVINSKNTFIN
jgi:type VI secretion system secreted protein VgrG